MPKDEPDVFIRTCPKCGEMWRGIEGRRDWEKRTQIAGIEKKEIFWYLGQRLNRKTKMAGTLEVVHREHIGCGGQMLTEGDLIDQRYCENKDESTKAEERA